MNSHKRWNLARRMLCSLCGRLHYKEDHITGCNITKIHHVHSGDMMKVINSKFSELRLYNYTSINAHKKSMPACVLLHTFFYQCTTFLWLYDFCKNTSIHFHSFLNIFNKHLTSVLYQNNLTLT